MKVCILLFCLGLVAARPEPGQQIGVEELEEEDNPEITEGFFEGDIELPTDRNAISNTAKLWPNGIVPYKISSEYPSTMVATILKAMREMENNTRHGDRYCIRFVERTTQSEYVYIRKLTGCHSGIGRHHGANTVSLGPGCGGKGTVMHELNHALGFWHEQNRYDRDDYVIIHYDNIAPSHRGNFNKHSSHNMNLLGSSYDFGSLMHYGPYSFAVDKSKPTISAKAGVATGLTMGQRKVMSTQDVWMIQKLYGCPVDTTHIVRPPTSQNVVACHFAKDLCGLKQDRHDDFDWIRHNGPTATNDTGPNADHTNGGGYYLYAEANGHHGKKARLLTPTAPAGQYCLNFFHFQHGSQEGSFQVLAAGTHIREQVLRRYYRDQGKNWRHRRINLQIPASFHIILQATISNGDQGDIAIDDFSMYHGRCL